MSSVCWRCLGAGEVKAFDGTMTPCGACLGTKVPPIPMSRMRESRGQDPG